MRKFLAFLAVLLLSASAFGMTIEAPSKVVVDSQGKTFTVTLNNKFNETVEFEFDIFFPARYEIEGTIPSRLGPHESKEFQLTVKHDSKLVGPTYTALLKASSSEFTLDKEIKLEFVKANAEDETLPPQQTKALEAQPAKADSIATGLTGLIILPAMPEMILDAVLILLAAILLIAFISRFAKRIH